MGKLEGIIRQYVNFTGTNAKGWEQCVHIGGCDHGHKGSRAAFNFHGDAVGFNCFNCGTKVVYDPASGPMSDEFKRILRDFGIDSSLYDTVVFNDFGKVFKKQDKPKTSKIEPVELPLPDNFYLLSDASDSDSWAKLATHYLEEERHLNPSDYPYMIARKSTTDPRLNKWMKRLIIPVYKNKKLIYYQGRDLTDNPKRRKYESPFDTEKDNIIFNFDKLFEYTDTPLLIIEGIFDALSVDGVAILGNEISKAHIEWLNMSKRTKVYIPDKFGDGKRTARKALAAGWSISTPDVGTGSRIKDMNDAVKKYGKLYTMQSIYNSISSGFEADINLEMYCSN